MRSTRGQRLTVISANESLSSWHIAALGLALAAAAMMALPAVAQIAPVDGTHYAARSSDTGFQGAVSSQGGFSASVPLDLPAVRGNLPLLARVAYGGHQVGAAGMGWDIPLSYIFRSTTIAHHRPAPQAFSVSAPTPLQAPELLSLTLGGEHIDLVRNAGDTAWVARRGNTQMEVRTSGDNMVMYDGEGRTYTFSPEGPAAGTRLVGGNLYMLVAIQGPGGNRVTFTHKYEAPVLPGGTTGLSINLVRVRYNSSPTTAQCFKNSVFFSYDIAATPPTGGTPPPILSMSELGGTTLARVNKIANVYVYSQPSCSQPEVPLRTYLFNYQPDVDTGQPRLQSVTMTGQKGSLEESKVLPVGTYSYGSIVDPNTRQITYGNFKIVPFGGGAPSYISYSRWDPSTEGHGPADVLTELTTRANLVDLTGDGRVDFLAPRAGTTFQMQYWRNRGDASGGSSLNTLIQTDYPAELDAEERIHSAAIGGANPNLPYKITPTVNDTMKLLIDMNGDGRLDVVEVAPLPDINHWIIHLNKPDPSDPTRSVVVDITVPVDEMRQALNTTGLSFGRVPLARRTTVPETFSSSNMRSRTITEFELKDVNGDGYPDFVYNTSYVRTADTTGTAAGDMVGSRDVKVLINTAGVHLADGVSLFASPITLESGGANGCGTERWEADPGSPSGGILNETCAFEDVNGDGLVDRVTSVLQNGQVVAMAALGTGVPDHPFSGATITLPGPIARTEANLVLNGGKYLPVGCPQSGSYNIRRSRGLRDINGDGIPDYVVGLGNMAGGAWAWTVAMGTGTTFTSPVTVNSPAGLELSYEQKSCAASGTGGIISGILLGLYDIDGDGQPEVVGLNGDFLVYQLKPSATQLDVGPVASVPAAGRLTQIDNGYGAVTHIGYKSAKEDPLDISVSLHGVPYPEIVATAVATTAPDDTRLEATRHYAYHGAGLNFDAAYDAFVFPGYLQTLTLLDTSEQTQGDGVITVTDIYGLTPYVDGMNITDRLKRYLQAGRIKDVTTLVGGVDTNPWLWGGNLSGVDGGAMRKSGVHYEWDARVLTTGATPKPPNNEQCLDMVFPYDFGGSQARQGATWEDECTKRGILFSKTVSSWRGEPGTGDPFTSTSTVKTRTEVKSVDNFERITTLARLNDSTPKDDDVCVRTVYATPNGTNERVLTAPASRTVIGDDCSNPALAPLLSESYEYDTSGSGKLPAGQVAAGLLTAKVVSRRNAETGATIGGSASDIRVFDATYDSTSSALTSTTSAREDGASHTTQLSYDGDPFFLVPTSATSTATNADGTPLPPLTSSATFDPLTLDLLSMTDANGTQIGSTFDGFGRVQLTTVTPPGGTLGVLSSMSYQGFATDERGGRQIVQKTFTDAVPQNKVSTAVGRTATTFLDSLGRPTSIEAALGADYANAIMVVGERVYDNLGRVKFVADPRPKTELISTAYGTTRLFNIDGTPSCFIRGKGPQAFTNAVDETLEVYPTCFSRTFSNETEVVSVQEADSLLSTTLQAGIAKSSTLSGSGRLLASSTTQRGSSTEYMTFTYDRLGDLTGLSRYGTGAAGGNPVTTAWHYDSLGQLLELDGPDSAAQSLIYSNWGELTKVQWCDSTTSPCTDRRVISRYDARGRLTHREDQTGNVVDTGTASDYLYDLPSNLTTRLSPTYVLGRLAQVSSATSKEAFSYDAFGRVNANAFADQNSVVAGIEQHTFHDDNTEKQLDLLLPDNNFNDERVDYTFDSAGRPRAVHYSDGALSQDVFTATGATDIDAFGRIRNAHYGAALFAATYADTGRKLLSDVTVTSPVGAKSREISFAPGADGVVAFDPVGRERFRREIRDGSTDSLRSEFQYRNVGQLATASVTAWHGNTAGAALESSDFTYDPLGNLYSLANDGTEGSGDVTLSYQSVDRDRICSIAFGSDTPNPVCNVKYDGVGNITEMPTRANGKRTLSYLASGLVKQVTDQSGNSASFAYDAFGDVQALTLSSNTSPDTRADRHYGSLISQRDEMVSGVKTSVTTRTIYGPGVAATRHGTTGTWTFAFGEQRGNRFFTDQNGAFVQDVTYHPFGEVNPTRSTGAQPGASTYSSTQWNFGDSLAAFGISQLGARMYDPVIGRFLSRDPLVIPRTAANTNPYAFADGDPVNASDPSGLVISTGPQGCPVEVCVAPSTGAVIGSDQGFEGGEYGPANQGFEGGEYSNSSAGDEGFEGSEYPPGTVGPANVGLDLSWVTNSASNNVGSGGGRGGGGGGVLFASPGTSSGTPQLEYNPGYPAAVPAGSRDSGGSGASPYPPTPLVIPPEWGEMWQSFLDWRENNEREANAALHGELTNKEMFLYALRIMPMAGVKSVSLPTWGKVAVDMEHIAERHVVGGIYTAGRSLFPVTMNETSILRAIREAYQSGVKVGVQGDRVLLKGVGAGLDIEMWFNRVTKTIETAYPALR